MTDPSDPLAPAAGRRHEVPSPHAGQTDLTRRYFVSVAARRWASGGYEFQHSVGAADDCDAEPDARAWAAEWADSQYPERHGWMCDVIVLKADRPMEDESQ